MIEYLFCDVHFLCGSVMICLHSHNDVIAMLYKGSRQRYLTLLLCQLYYSYMISNGVIGLGSSTWHNENTKV